MFKFRRKVKKGYLDDRQNGGIDDIVKTRQQTMSSTDVKEDVHKAQEERNVTTIVSDNPKCKFDYKSDNQETQSKTKKTAPKSLFFTVSGLFLAILVTVFHPSLTGIYNKKRL